MFAVCTVKEEKWSACKLSKDHKEKSSEQARVHGEASRKSVCTWQQEKVSKRSKQALALQATEQQKQHFFSRRS